MDVLVWTLVGFLSGSIPFSLLLGRLAGRGDVRAYGDHNPGAANVLRAAGWRWGVLAVLLDGFKGAIPVGLAWFFYHVEDWAIVPVALAPVFGHAFSPWLRWRGGKAVATTFGIWTGLTLGVGPTVLGLLLGLMFAVFTISGWAVLLAMLAFGVFIITYYGPSHPEFISVWLGNLFLLVVKHRDELAHLPAIRPGVVNLLGRKE
jgi:acyl phosphate:glycerol-3-phosphate acyltransferase